MVNRVRWPVVAAVAVTALSALQPSSSQAQDPNPAVVVISQSLSSGLSLATENCPAALKALTGGVLVRSSITHITAIGSRLRELVVGPALAPAPVVPLTALAYTLEGPRNEVAILVCVPDTAIKR